MMFRIQYLLGLLSAIFGVLYIFFGIVGWHSDTATAKDRAMPFFLSFVHLSVSGFLLYNSHRNRKTELNSLDSRISELLRTYTSLTPADISALIDVSLGEAQEHLLNIAPDHKHLKVVISANNTIRVYPKYAMN
jgi:hypothetical protein